MMAQTIMKI